MKEFKKFYEHLEECERCRTRPFDLCSVGRGLLNSIGKPFVKSVRIKLSNDEKVWEIKHLLQDLKPLDKAIKTVMALNEFLDSLSPDEVERVLQIIDSWCPDCGRYIFSDEGCICD